MPRLRPIYTVRFCRMQPPYDIRLRHFLGHNCRKNFKHVYKSYNFFRAGKCAVRRLHATKSYRVLNWPLRSPKYRGCLTKALWSCSIIKPMFESIQGKHFASAEVKVWLRYPRSLYFLHCYFILFVIFLGSSFFQGFYAVYFSVYSSHSSPAHGIYFAG